MIDRKQMNRANMKLRVTTVLTATISALLLALVSTPAHASVPPDGTYLCATGVASGLTPNFTITAGAVSLGSSCAGAVVIPAGVTSFATNAFVSFGSGAAITSITIPASVTSIGQTAFYNTPLLTAVTFEAGSLLTSIGDTAFSRTTALTSITIPASVTSIGPNAFLSSGLTSITIPAGSLLTSIGDLAFFGVSSLTTITIPAGVTSIGLLAFSGATSLASVYFLGNAPTTVGPSAFDLVAAGKAYIKTGATGFGTIGGLWNNLIIENESAAPSAASIANAYRVDKLATVYFSPLSSKLSKAAKKQLEAAVIANPSAVYKVTGYVQKSIFARNAKNDSLLSLARAKAIETHLESLGAGVTFTVVVDGAGVPVKNGKSNKARRSTLYAMTPVVQ